MSKVVWPDFDLTLFDGGAAAVGSAGAAAPAGASEGAAPQQTETQGSPGGSRRGKTGALAGVVYGKGAQAEAETPGDAAESGSDAGSQGKKEAETQTTSDTLEERRARFRELVDGEFKDLFNQETQRVIDRRFKETRALQSTLEAQKPILEQLMARYQISDGDMGKLSKALEGDTAYWAQAAEEAGMSVEQFQQFQKLRRENETFRNAQQQMARKQAADDQTAKWMREAEELRRDYPGFDLGREIGNQQFLSMLKAGIPVRHAFEVAHLDDIKGSLTKQTQQQTERRVVDDIRAKGTRPIENGVTAQSGITVKSDPSKLSKADRLEIARRVARGEKISF